MREASAPVVLQTLENHTTLLVSQRSAVLSICAAHRLLLVTWGKALFGLHTKEPWVRAYSVSTHSAFVSLREKREREAEWPVKVRVDLLSGFIEYHLVKWIIGKMNGAALRFITNTRACTLAGLDFIPCGNCTSLFFSSLHEQHFIGRDIFTELIRYFCFHWVWQSLFLNLISNLSWICRWNVFSSLEKFLLGRTVKLIWHLLKGVWGVCWLKETSHPFPWPMSTSGLWANSHHCHYSNREWLCSPRFFTFMSHPREQLLTLFTAQRSLFRDYDSVAASSESISSATLSGCGIDGSYELLGSRESNIGGLRIEELQQK